MVLICLMRSTVELKFQIADALPSNNFFRFVFHSQSQPLFFQGFDVTCDLTFLVTPEYLERHVS